MKKELRLDLKKERACLDLKQREIWDQQITEQLLSWYDFNQLTKVMVYLSIDWEISTWILVEELTKLAAEIYVPVVQKKPKQLVPTRYLTKANLVARDFGILEPEDLAATIDPLELDVIVVPGLAFTNEGYRLGFGGGYYDRFLPTTRGVSLGLCYTDFIRELPTQVWDYAVDFLVTEEGIRAGKS